MFHVGQQIECVADGAIPPDGRGVTGTAGWDHRIKRGAIYTVRWCGADEWDGLPSVKLVGVVRGLLDHRGFCASRFRPLQDSKLEVFRALLVDLPALPKFEPTKERV